MVSGVSWFQGFHGFHGFIGFEISYVLRFYRFPGVIGLLCHRFCGFVGFLVSWVTLKTTNQ